MKPMRLPTLLLGATLCAACGANRSDETVLDVSSDRLQRFQADDRLYEVREILPDDGGTWVLGGIEPYLYRFDPQGRLVGTYLREGDGPGEVRNPWSLAQADAASGDLAVWDVARRAMHRVDGEGAFRGAFSLHVRGATVRGDVRSVSHADPHKLRTAPDGYVLQVPTGPVTHTSDLFAGALLRMDREGAVRDTILSFRSLLPAGQAPVSASLADVPLWDVCPGGSVVVYDPVAGAVLSFADGRAEKRAVLDLPSRDLADGDIRPYLRSVVAAELSGQMKAPEEIDRLVEQVLPGARGQFPARTPKAVNLLCDGDGRVWLNEFSTADHPLGFGRTWSVYDGDRRVRRVRLPLGFRPLVIRGDALYGVITDADDVQSPASLPLPSL